jgi:hypothetical protein
LVPSKNVRQCPSFGRSQGGWGNEHPDQNFTWIIGVKIGAFFEVILLNIHHKIDFGMRLKSGHFTGFSGTGTGQSGPDTGVFLPCFSGGKV